MISNLAVLPIVIPLIAGVLAALFHKKLKIVRIYSQVLTLINTVVVTYILLYVQQNGSVVLESGDWMAPFGIVLVADMLSLSLVLTTNIVAIACIFYAPK